MINIIRHTFYEIKSKVIRLNKGKVVFLVLLFSLFFLFSYIFFINQLTESNSKIYTSDVYWDFQWHMPLIQNFAYGDNFPPQNESFAGFPATYHFFWGVLVAIYTITGLQIVNAINFITIISFFFLLLAIVGISDEIFLTKFPGVIAVIFSITSSSLRFISDLYKILHNNLTVVMQYFLFNTTNPYLYSFIRGNPYGYNGTMFNLYYFLAERQMIPGVIYLIFIVWLLYKKDEIKTKYLFLIGIGAGMFFLWHLYITVMVLCALLFVLLIDKNKKSTLMFFIGFLIAFTAHVVYFKLLQQSNWFIHDVSAYPKINFNFPTLNNEYTLSIAHFIGYYLYGYGFKVFFLIAGILFLWKQNRRACLIILSIIIPTFVLINTVQLSPLSIYDNHKWLRPMNIIIDIISGYAFYYIFIKTKKYIPLLIGMPILLCLTFSGIIELIPFFNVRPIIFFVNEQSPLVKIIRSKTPRKSIFVGNDAKEIHLAGRKLFLGNYSGQDLRLDSNKRQAVINGIYKAKTKNEICSFAINYKIDYIENNIKSSNLLNAMHVFKSVNQNNNIVTFVNVARSCR
jgi:hypothetical protein